MDQVLDHIDRDSIIYGQVMVDHDAGQKHVGGIYVTRESNGYLIFEAFNGPDTVKWGFTHYFVDREEAVEYAVARKDEMIKQYTSSVTAEPVS